MSLLFYFSLDFDDLSTGLAIGRAGADLMAFLTSYLMDDRAQIKAMTIVG